MTLRAKLWGLLVALVGVGLTMLLIFVVGLRINSRYIENAMLWDRHALAVKDMLIAANSYSEAVHSLWVEVLPEDEELRRAERAMDKALDASRSLAKHFDQKEQAEEAELAEVYVGLREIGENILKLQRQGRSRQVLGLDQTRFHKTRDLLNEEIIERAREEEDGAREWQARSAKLTRRILWMGTSFLILAWVFGFIIVFHHVRYLMRAIGGLREGLRKIAAGELGLQIPVIVQDELGNMAQAFNQMSRDLEEAREEMKKAQARMLQSEKLSAVGQLAGGVAHEINNPLGVILGFAQSVVRRMKGDDPLSMPLKAIEREALRCKNLVQSLLTFSRATQDERLSGTDPNAAILESLSLIQVRSKISGIELIQELDIALPAVKANKNQLQQVIINLCNNAIDAMSRGGRITLRTCVSQRKADHVEIQVRDTGAGIPPEIQARIFEPFFTTKEVGKGTGLGLALVYEIIQKHEGSIELQSEVGHGTTFTVYLPMEPVRAMAAVR